MAYSTPAAGRPSALSVDLLLSDFPSPPSFIPPSPSGFRPASPGPNTINPPPSLPPSSPLPPVPGPSPLSTADLSVMAHVPARSRPASKISIATSASASTSSMRSSWRDSTASSTSTGSGHTHNHPSPSGSTHTFGFGSPTSGSNPGGVARVRSESLTSVSQSSLRSKASSSSSLCAPRIDMIRESDEVSVNTDDDDEDMGSRMPSLTRTSLADIPRSSPSPSPFPIPLTPPNEPDADPYADASLAEIDMADLPRDEDVGVDDDDDDEAAERDLHARAQALHFEMRAARSKSAPHKSRIASQASPSPPPLSASTSMHTHSQSASASTSAAAARRRVASEFSASRPPSEFGVLSQPEAFGSGSGASSHRHPPSSYRGRPPSPDVASILASTPRPRRRSEASASASVRSRSSAYSRSSVHSRLSRSSLPYVNDGASDAGWNEESFLDDYGDGFINDDEYLPGEGASGGEESADSDLDLHTPLPNLMLKHGMLSPSSKLLAQSRAVTPAASNGRPGSTLSVNSTMTKSGVYKDDRDTHRRRERHRDGRMLRGGIGLTTGLGWSDSEDEDKPSALTRRVSSLALNRSSSTASLPSLARTSSSTSLHYSGSRAPPLPSQRSSSSSSKANLARSQSSGSRIRSRTDVSNRRARNSEPSPAPPDTPNTPRALDSSTSSTASLRTPTTPAISPFSASEHLHPDSYAYEDVGAFELADPPRPSAGGRRRVGDREKSLPPLPRLSRGASIKRETSSASLIRQPSSASLRPPAAKFNPALSTGSSTQGSEHKPLSREPSTSSLRAPSVKYSARSSPSGSLSASTPSIPPSSVYPLRSSSLSSSTSMPLPTSPSSPPVLSPPSPGPRPLLTASVAAPLQPGEPVAKSLLGYNRNLHDAQRMRYNSGLARRPSLGSPRSPPAVGADGGDKPRPRIGAGMVYRKSEGGGGGRGGLTVTVPPAGARAGSALPSPTASYTGAIAI